jgi:hypothetical protein
MAERIMGRVRCGGCAVGLVAVALALTGCGGSSKVDPDVQNVGSQVTGLGDLAGMPEQFALAFVPGAAPKDAAAYGDYGYEVVGPATINGDTATVEVKIFGGVHSPADGDAAKKASASGEFTKTWTLQKVGEEWKIKDAPLQ